MRRSSWIIMGCRCRCISEDDALDYALGYCNGNDLFARDLQFLTSQWLPGTALKDFGPIGPYLLTADEVGDPSNLEIIGRRSGEIVQHSNTSQMIFSCRYLISYLSQLMMLEPGDIILTGTPEGVILGQPENHRQWLEPGESVAVEIKGVGELITHVGPFL